MRVLLTNDFERWVQGCDEVSLERYPLNNFLDSFSEKIYKSVLLRDQRLAPGTAAALVEYEIKRKEPVIAVIKSAALACISLPMRNGELEEHYYHINNRGEWLTENPFLAQYQYWFSNVEKKGVTGNEYYASIGLPTQDLASNELTVNAVFLGGRMNWTHWNVDCLAPLLLLSPTIGEYLITSKLNTWQLDGLSFFGYSKIPRIQVSNGSGLIIARINRLRFIWNFDQIDRYSFLRDSIGRVGMPPAPHQYSGILAPDFDLKTRVQRVANPKQLKSKLSRYPSKFIQPANLDYASKVSLYSGANIILSLPGSDSINALLFARQDAKIIQMIPWPNTLMATCKYSMIVAYRQMAYQTSFNITPYYGSPVAMTRTRTDFDAQFYFCHAELERILLLNGA